MVDTTFTLSVKLFESGNDTLRKFVFSAACYRAEMDDWFYIEGMADPEDESSPVAVVSETIEYIAPSGVKQMLYLRLHPDDQPRSEGHLEKIVTLLPTNGWKEVSRP